MRVPVTIDPIQPSGPRPARDKAVGRHDEANRANTVAPGSEDAPRESDAPKTRGDRIQLSEAAKLLTEERLTAAAGRPSGTLPPDKLALVSQRLLEGFYDTDAVRQAIAEGLLKDLKILE